jgi:hypothetical protein
MTAIRASAANTRKRADCSSHAIPGTPTPNDLLGLPETQMILLQWGYTWPDIYEWYRQLFFGFHIGNTQVSFAVLLASVIVFGLAYAAARIFEGWLDAHRLQSWQSQPLQVPIPPLQLPEIGFQTAGTQGEPTKHRPPGLHCVQGKP